MVYRPADLRLHHVVVTSEGTAKLIRFREVPPDQEREEMIRLDVFSFGKLLWEILTERLPYADPRDSLEWWAASERNRPSLEHGTRITRLRRGAQMRDLISRCWREPEARPAAGEIVRDLQAILAKTPLESLLSALENLLACTSPHCFHCQLIRESYTLFFPLYHTQGSLRLLSSSPVAFFCLFAFCVITYVAGASAT
jgi:hypothetical protein